MAAGTQMQSNHSLWLRPAGERGSDPFRCALMQTQSRSRGCGVPLSGYRELIVTPISLLNTSPKSPPVKSESLYVYIIFY